MPVLHPLDLRYQPIGIPTGRDEFPSLPVRSRRDPAQVQAADYPSWVQAWRGARTRLAADADRAATHRWDATTPTCA